MQVRGPLGLRQLEFTGTPNADYQDLILGSNRSESLRQICRSLHTVRRRWDMIVLRNLPEESPTRNELKAEFQRLGLGVLDMEPQPCPTLAIRGHEAECDALLARYSVRRVMRSLSKLGPLKLEMLDTADQIDQNLPLFFEQHVVRRAGTSAASPFIRDDYRRWYREMAHAASARGWLHFSRLDCGSKPVAFHFGFQYGSRLSWYKPSFDPSLAGLSPGTALIQHLIENARERGLAEIDFGGGLEPFKARFSNTQRSNRILRVFANRALHLAFLTGARLRGHAKRIRQRWRGPAEGVQSNG